MLKAIAAALLLALHACGAGNESRSITVASSTALLPLVKEAAIAYRAAHPGIDITVSGASSRGAIALVAQKAVDVAASDIPVDDPSLVDHRIACGHIYTNGQPSALVADFVNFMAQHRCERGRDRADRISV